MIFISQNGENLGGFDELRIRHMISEGEIDDTAFFWRDGMEDWKPIRELEFNNGLTEKAPDDIKAKSDMNQPNPEHLAFLDYHSVKYSNLISRTEAKDLVDKTRQRYADSKWNLIKHLVRPDLFEWHTLEERSVLLRKSVGEAKEKYESLKKDKNADPDDIKSALEEYEDSKMELESEKEEIAEAIEDWSETFSDKESFDLYDDKSLPLLLKAYKKPSKTQIKEVLKHFNDVYKYPSELIDFKQFFFVYGKLYPESLKKGANVKYSFSDIVVAKTYHEFNAKNKGGGNTSKPKGCLVLILGLLPTFFLITFAIIFFFFTHRA